VFRISLLAWSARQQVHDHGGEHRDERCLHKKGRPQHVTNSTVRVIGIVKMLNKQWVVCPPIRTPFVPQISRNHGLSCGANSIDASTAKPMAKNVRLILQRLRQRRIEAASLIFFWLLFEIFHRGVAEYPIRDPSCEGEQDTEPEGKMPEQRGKADNKKGCRE